MKHPLDILGRIREDIETEVGAVKAKNLFLKIYRSPVLASELIDNLPSPIRVLDDGFGTKKVLWKLSDGKNVESVLLPQVGRHRTLCISSQVGCAMACEFCLTGKQGLSRHLKTSEIVAQVLLMSRDTKITNLVFMGMGEPMHNFAAVRRACHILRDDYGLNFSRRQITISTSGLIPGILALAEEKFASLAVSLNASNDSIRSQIMPVNLKYPIHQLIDALKVYVKKTRQRVMLEYVLLDGLTASKNNALELIELIQDLPCKINLLPWNEHSSARFQRPSEDTVDNFATILRSSGISTTIRQSRGRNILAACGQLASASNTI
ncbi:MAG: 23S rRNA (adenine(2503)-C(2))-methyltransferase RlmN [Candidatus Cloacimonetes bacterium]|nr:23S rRNA (adenine(2503)-C(2))-methyltransferase RlmN [Candidatus Cloacimonadota bacterium]